MITPQRRKELEKKFSFLVGEADDAIEVFNDMFSKPEMFHHDGQGSFKLVDPEAAKKMPEVQEAIRMMDMKEKLDEDGDEFLKGLGL